MYDTVTLYNVDFVKLDSIETVKSLLPSELTVQVLKVFQCNSLVLSFVDTFKHKTIFLSAFIGITATSAVNAVR